MSSYFGLFVTDGYGKIKSYNGNFYKLNKLEGFNPEGEYIDDYFHELSPHMKTSTQASILSSHYG